METNLLIGIMGMTLVLMAFMLNNVNKWKSSDFMYDFTNLVGSASLAYYAFSLKSYPFLIVNSIWGIISLKDVIMSLVGKKTKKNL